MTTSTKEGLEILFLLLWLANYNGYSFLEDNIAIWANRCLLNTFYVLDSLLVSGVTALTKTEKVPIFIETVF